MNYCVRRIFLIRRNTDMRMQNPEPTFSYFVSEVAKRFPSLAYLHLIEPRVNAGVDRVAREGEVSLRRTL